MLCQKAHEECGSSWNGELPKETIGHIQSAGGLGHKEVVTVAHNACIRELLQEVNVQADRHMRLLTIETESRLSTLWDQEESNQFCSKEELWEAARVEEMKIPWQEANEGAPVPEEQYQERFWRRRLDGVCATADAQEQYKSLLAGLQTVGQVKGLKVQLQQQIVFIGGTCGSVHVESFNINMKAFGGSLRASGTPFARNSSDAYLRNKTRCYGPTSHKKEGRGARGTGTSARAGNMFMGHICVKIARADLGQVTNSRFSEKRGNWGWFVCLLFSLV